MLEDGSDWDGRYKSLPYLLIFNCRRQTLDDRVRFLVRLLCLRGVALLCLQPAQLAQNRPHRARQFHFLRQRPRRFEMLNRLRRIAIPPCQHRL